MERSEGRGASTSSGSPTFFLGGGFLGFGFRVFYFFWVSGFGLGLRASVLDSGFCFWV